MLDRTMSSSNLGQFSAQVGPVVQQAQAGGKEVVDYAFSRDAFPGTSCQATIGVVPTGRAGRHLATASSLVLSFENYGNVFRQAAGATRLAASQITPQVPP
jgi:hypothetical protein